MKSRIIAVLLALSVASVASAALFDDSVAPQSYHVIGDKNAAKLHKQLNLTPNNTTTLVAARPMQSNQPSSAVATKSAAAPSARAANANSTAAVPGVVFSNPLQVEQNKIKSDLAQTVQQELLFEAKTQQQMHKMQQQNSILINSIQQLYQTVSQLKQQAFKPVPSANQSVQNTAQHSSNWFIELFAGLVLLVLILAMTVMYAFGRRKGLRQQQSDYAFVGEEEVGSKIDLAHAYIAMGNFLDAKKLLTDLDDSGDSAQQMEVQQLLTTLSAKLNGVS